MITPIRPRESSSESCPSSVHVRAIRPTDTAELKLFYGGLSAESRRRRFFSVSPGLSQAQSVSFCTTDHDHKEGFVAVVDDGPEMAQRIVGHLCLEPDGANASEVAIAVADEFQYRGIGRHLMAAGVAWARRTHVTRLTATMLAGNAAIHRLLVGLGLPTQVNYIGSGVAQITIDVVAERLAA
jgi:GNAT superfamily N-acetyltransferase